MSDSSDSDSHTITQLLHADPAAGGDRLWATVYPELRRRARAMFSSERPGHTFSATAVVHEVFLRLASTGPREWENRGHFYAVASDVMRHVLIDHARAKATQKRGSGVAPESLDESMFAALSDDSEGFDAASQALEKLAEKHERPSLVVALRVFGGLSVAEVAEELEVSERTVKTDWVLARVKLQKILVA